MIAMMRSPSSGRAKMTPMVLRAVGRTSEALTWTSLPDSVMTMTSSSGRTTRAPTRPPRSSTSLPTRTPRVPRDLVGYSSTGVRLA